MTMLTRALRFRSTCFGLLVSGSSSRVLNLVDGLHKLAVAQSAYELKPRVEGLRPSCLHSSVGIDPTNGVSRVPVYLSWSVTAHRLCQGPAGCK